MYSPEKESERGFFFFGKRFKEQQKFTWRAGVDKLTSLIEVIKEENFLKILANKVIYLSHLCEYFLFIVDSLLKDCE